MNWGIVTMADCAAHKLPWGRERIPAGNLPPVPGGFIILPTDGCKGRPSLDLRTTGTTSAITSKTDGQKT